VQFNNLFTKLRKNFKAPSLTGSALSAACAWGAVWLVTLTACWLEAAHRVGSGGAASLGGTIAILGHVTSRVVRGCNVPVSWHDVVWGVAVSAAGVVHLQLEWNWALVLTALDLGARWLEGALAETVLHLRTILQLDALDCCHAKSDNASGLHCSGY